VDLNRNFGHAPTADHKPPGDEQYAGPDSFSEPESRIVKALVDEVRPDIYLSVHSGAYLLGMPFGYTSGVVPENEANMMEVLGPISKKYCGGNCPYGNLAKLIHYDSPGCDIDYVAEQVGTPYAFTWEIYTGEDFRDRYIEQARKQHGESASNSEGHDSSGLDLIQMRHGRGRQTQRKAAVAAALGAAADRSDRSDRGLLRVRKPEATEIVSDCLRQFNPKTREETESVLTGWTGAYLELCEEVVAKQQKGQQ